MVSVCYRDRYSSFSLGQVFQGIWFCEMVFSGDWFNSVGERFCDDFVDAVDGFRVDEGYGWSTGILLRRQGNYYPGEVDARRWRFRFFQVVHAGYVVDKNLVGDSLSVDDVMCDAVYYVLVAYSRGRRCGAGNAGVFCFSRGFVLWGVSCVGCGVSLSEVLVNCVCVNVAVGLFLESRDGRRIITEFWYFL